MMANKFEMSMIGELSYFLGLQIKQLKNGTFVSQGKYIKDILKKFGINEAKAISTPMGANGNLDSHYYRLIYHYHHFDCCSDISNCVILPPLVRLIARNPKKGNWQLRLLPPIG